MLLVCWPQSTTLAQMGIPTPLPQKEQQKAAAENESTGVLPNYPQIVDITASTGIHFEHLSSPEAKFSGSDCCATAERASEQASMTVMRTNRILVLRWTHHFARKLLAT